MTLFEATTLNGMPLANRLVRSATWEGMADPAGSPTRQMVDLYRELARGGIGLLISGNAYVSAEGQNMPFTMGIDRDDLETAYAPLVEAVHAEGGRIALQVIHAGGQTSSELTGRKPVAPSALATAQFPEIPEELSREGIAAIVEDFRQAARRAKAWGFDALQFHGGHGYLISQFLSPHTNRRDDEYGGSLENRCRFLLEICRAARAEVGPHYPLLIKLNIADFLEGGLSSEEGVAVARLVAAAGIDAIETSAGTMVSGDRMPTRLAIDRPELEAYHLDLARRVKEVVDCPVMVVGGFRSLAVAEQAVGAAGIDYVALSRPLIMEPDLPRRWREGDRSRSRCVSCNGCLNPGLEGRGIYCVVDRTRTAKDDRRTT